MKLRPTMSTTQTTPGQRIPSPQCAANIRSFEQCRLVGYKPTPKDVPTIGWGSTGRGIFVGLSWTQEQADTRFVSDLAMFAHGVDHLLAAVPTTQGQFDALVSFAYNVGLDDDADSLAEGLGDSSLLRKHRAGDFDGAAAEFPKWNKQAGKVLNGLTVRRLREQAMYRA